MGLFIGTSIINDQYHYTHLSFDKVTTGILTGISTVGIITHPSAAASDQFGYSVAVGSGRIVVGAYADDVGGLTNAGSAHIYDLNGGYVGIITHPSAAANDQFGLSVAVGSGRIVVGAYLDDIGIGLTNAGSAHIYDLNGGYVGIITHPSAAAFDQFGTSVAVGCGRIVVGARFDDIDALSDAGSAHIYDLNGNYVGILTHPTAATDDQFGTSVAVGSGRIVVGAYLDDIGALSYAGSAHIYDLNGNYVGIITHPSAAASDNFGFSVAVGSGRIVVGAYADNVGIGLTNAGSAHIYDLNGGYVGIITHPSAAADDRFGFSVAVGSGRIVVGAYLDDIGIGLTDAGSAHIYDLNGNYVGILTHPSAAASDLFGTSVAVGSGRIVVGAYRDDIGIGLTDAGSAHIYKINENIDTYYEEILDNYKY
jgi:hypothetical protein